MFCPNCGAHIKETKESTKVSRKVEVVETEIDINKNPDVLKVKQEDVELCSNDDVLGLCPYCGKPISSHLNEAEIKKLNQVAHAKVHTARNKFNSGMCGIVIGTILLLIALIFLLLSFPVQNNREFKVDGEPFIVFCALSAICLFAFIFGVIYLIKSRTLKVRYSNVIRDIQNKTFVQKIEK